MSIIHKLKQYGIEDVKEKAVDELKEMCSNKARELTEEIEKKKIELAKKIIMNYQDYERTDEDEFSQIQEEIEQLEDKLYDVNEFSKKL